MKWHSGETPDSWLYETSIETAVMDNFIQKVRGCRTPRPRSTTPLDLCAYLGNTYSHKCRNYQTSLFHVIMIIISGMINRYLDHEHDFCCHVLLVCFIFLTLYYMEDFMVMIGSLMLCYFYADSKCLIRQTPDAHQRQDSLCLHFVQSWIVLCVFFFKSMLSLQLGIWFIALVILVYLGHCQFIRVNSRSCPSEKLENWLLVLHCVNIPVLITVL